jgi:hypothetical protein
MAIIGDRVQRHAVIIFTLTLFLRLTASQALAQDNSRAFVQDDNSSTFSHDVRGETITFQAINPRSKVAGLMTVAITGVFNGNRLWDDQSPVGSHLKGDQQAIFSFVPYDPYQPRYSATIRLWKVAGDTTDDSILFDFGLRTTGSDGSVQWFMLREVVTVTEDGTQIAFGQLKLPDALITQPELPCGTAID